MYNDEPKARRFYAVSYNEDEPTVSLGSLIPPRKKPAVSDGTISFAPRSVRSMSPKNVVSPYVLSVKIVTLIFSIATLVLVSSLSMNYFNNHGKQLLAQVFSAKTNVTPVIVENPYTKEQTPLNYGVQMTFNEPNFFTETLNSFIKEEKTFVEADLTTMKLRFFDKGVLLLQLPILAKGNKGSWWETPAGLYAIKTKAPKQFSTFGQVNTKWNLDFQGNFFIHGWPYEPNGKPVPDTYTGGCIRLSDTDAEKLYNLVDVNTPILVHEASVESDGFMYEPKVPHLATPHYLVADVDSNTVLAGNELDEQASIASLTKLMTALIAAENINLDKSVYVDQPSFVTTLIPRLAGLNKVSMYSLLQLLLVESSNESAEVIAAQIDRGEFIRLMNEKAKSLGMTQSQFVDPSGLGAGNKSSIRDLLTLVQYIYNNRKFIIELTANQDLPTAYVSGQFGHLSNFNKIEGLDNFIGGKVGETTAAGQTSVSLHTINVKGTQRVIAIILLGSTGRNADVKALLQYAIERFGS